MNIFNNKPPDRMNDEIKTAADLARDPASVSWATYALVATLAIWGGIVRVIREAKLGDKTWKQIALIFLVESITSGFAGFMTFFVCEAQQVDRFYAAALSGIAGYMGGRALTLLEIIYKAKTASKD